MGQGPRWAQYAATDRTGERHWYKDKPYIRYSKEWFAPKGRIVSFGYHDWQNTLEERPKSATEAKSEKELSISNQETILQQQVFPNTLQSRYASIVAALAKDGADIFSSLTPEKCHAWHMASCICGEAGEVFDVVKKHVIYNQPLNRDAVIEELGDLEFYMQGLRDVLGISRIEILEANIAKLEKRYPGLLYTDERAKERADKKGEKLQLPEVLGEYLVWADHGVKAVAWFNPSSGHWSYKNKNLEWQEVGFMDRIRMGGMERQIVKWQTMTPPSQEE